MFIIVGLGNPTRQYEGTKHNVGFDTIDYLIDEYQIPSSGAGHKALFGKGMIAGQKVIVAKPMTYMNLSGKAVRYWMNELNVPLENLIVICDDLNLPFGTLRMRKNGSSGGHNGLNNINELLGTEAYARIRMGIGNDFSRGQQIDFVLGKLSDEELAMMDELSRKVINACRSYATIGPDRAMTELNSKAKQAKIG